MIRRLILLCLPLLLLVGCNRTEAPRTAPVTNGFSCDFTGNLGDMALAGTLTRRTTGMLILSLTAPEELRGLSMNWDGEQMTVAMYGITVPFDVNSVPEAALGRRILRALDEVTYQTAEGTLTPEGLLRTDGAAADGAAFSLFSDPESGALHSLSVPSEGLSLTFSDFVTT